MGRSFRKCVSIAIFACLFAIPCYAQTVDPLVASKKVVVLVECGSTQGSGTVINGVEGYVLTNGHVVLDVETGAQKASCEVAFADADGRPQTYYRASIVQAVFNEKLNQDFAILQIGSPVGQRTVPKPYPSLTTNEFTARGDIVHVYGFSGVRDRLEIRSGTILDYVAGYVQTSAEVSSGDSGGAGFDDVGRLIGIPTRIVTLTSSSGTETVYFELVDIRAVMNWLDTFGFNEHDRYFTHSDYVRYHRNAVFITQDQLGCYALGRSLDRSSVYCLMSDDTRLPFPNDVTYFSWFSDFSDVETYSTDSLVDFQLTRNVTFKPGTLVKSRTMSRVYVVVDAFGTLRWIPSEARAIELWGSAWSGLVRDIPDEFWTNYSIGQPLDS